MKRPTEQGMRMLNGSGNIGRYIKLYSYVVTLCKKNGSEVMAVRMEYFQNKTDVYKAVAEKYPEWKIKTTNKLYEEDFDE